MSTMSESRPIEVGFRKPPDTPRPGPTVRARVVQVTGDATTTRDDSLATEEPLEIRVHHHDAEHPIAVTMRTPGNDFELAAGFLFGEGIIRDRDDVTTVSYCKSGPPEQLYNIVTVELRDHVDFEPHRSARAFYTTSSCGVCGKASLEALSTAGCARLPDGFAIDAEVIVGMPKKLRANQRIFERTGGLHAAGLFDAAGEILFLREDVGRHNAVDKVIGKLVMDGEVPAADRVLQVSGRTSFEIMQKALVAGIPIVSAVSAPSSLAAHLAEEFNVGLVGFVRGDSFNVYASPSRIRFKSSGVSASTSAADS
jgi:FdhD protein